MVDKLAYTINEAAAAIGLGRTTLYRMIRAGELHAIKIGGRTLIRADSLTRLIEEGKPNP